MGAIRRWRAVAILGGVWGASWSICGAVLGAVAGWSAFPRSPMDLRLEQALTTAAAAASTYGRVAFAFGALFAGGLVLIHRRRSLNSLRLWPVAATGAVAGAVLPLVSVAISDGYHRLPLLALVQPIALGATSGVASLLLARWALRRSSDARPPATTPTASTPAASAAT